MYLGNWTEKLARACARRPWVTIGIWAVAIVVALFFIVTLLGDALVTEIEPTNNPESSEALDIMDERLGISAYENLDETFIIRSSTLTVDDAGFQSHVEELYGELMALGDEVFLSGFTYYMTMDPSMVSADGHSTFIALTMPWEADERIDDVYEIGDSYATDSFEIFYTGSASFMADSMELGVVSEPFRSRYGWHILEVTDRRVYDNTEEMKELNCANRIRAGKLEEETLLWLQRMRDEAFVDKRI